VTLDVAGVTPSADVSALAAVLPVAAPDGRVDAETARKVMADLDRQLKLFAVAGPTATPDLYKTPPEQTAYWLNARAVWSIKLVLLRDCPKQPCPNLRSRKFPLDGRQMSLADIDAKLLAEARRSGDFLIAACAPGAEVDAAPLPTGPYLAATLRTQLSDQLDRLVRDELRMPIDVEARTIALPRLMWEVRDMITGWYKRTYGGQDVDVTTALRPWVSAAGRRRLDLALGYTAVKQPDNGALAVKGRTMYFPGSVGKVEVP
jgi:hypothetical protein